MTKEDKDTIYIGIIMIVSLFFIARCDILHEVLYYEPTQEALELEEAMMRRYERKDDEWVEVCPYCARPYEEVEK